MQQEYTRSLLQILQTDVLQPMLFMLRLPSHRIVPLPATVLFAHLAVVIVVSAVVQFSFAVVQAMRPIYGAQEKLHPALQ
jgi:hypothetical protein